MPGQVTLPIVVSCATNANCAAIVAWQWLSCRYTASSSGFGAFTTQHQPMSLNLTQGTGNAL